MANSHKISGSALIALKEALTNIYWIKNDLKMFVNHTPVEEAKKGQIIEIKNVSFLVKNDINEK